MKHIWQAARLDIAIWIRMPWAIVAAIVPPLGMTFVIAMLTMSVGRQPVALVVEGTGPQSQAMAKIIRADDEAYFVHEANLADAAKMLGEQRVTAVIVIPRDFDQRVVAGQASVDLTLNNADIDFSDDIRRAVDRSVAEYDAPQLGSSITKVGVDSSLAIPNPYRVDIYQQNLRNVDVPFFRSQTVPVLLLLIINVGVLGGALLGTRDQERGTMNFLRLTPIPRWALVLGRLTGTLVVTVAVTIPTLLILEYRDIIRPPADHWPVLALLLFATAVFASGMGTLLGVLFKKSATVAITAVIVASYLFFLGGGFTTVVFMPNWLNSISHLVPTRYAIDALRQILFYDELVNVKRNLVILSAFSAGTVALAAGVLRRSYR